MRELAWVLCVGTLVMGAGCKKATPRKREPGSLPAPVIDPARPQAGATPLVPPDARVTAAGTAATPDAGLARAAALNAARDAGILGILKSGQNGTFGHISGQLTSSEGFDDVDMKGLLDKTFDPGRGTGLTGGWRDRRNGTESDPGSGPRRGGLHRSRTPSPAPKQPVPPARTSPPAPAMP